MAALNLRLGVKTDPVEYRFSYPWLFRILAEEGVEYVQLGTFFEIYQLPDEFFQRLRRSADEFGLRIHSIFTSHRELGGFFIDEPGWEAVARRNYERLIDVGALVGAQSVGSNPGAVYRDQMADKDCGVARYVRHMKELMQYAHRRGVAWLTIEPMSSLAEPPTLPDEIRHMGEELSAWHAAHPDTTAQVGFCTDVAHGYADQSGAIQCDHLALVEATLPYLFEIHLKNTDDRYCSTFGFSDEDRARGVVQIEPIRELLLRRRDVLPVDTVVGYLELGGPKLGRDYTDPALAEQLRRSLRYLKGVWPTEQSVAGTQRGDCANFRRENGTVPLDATVAPAADRPAIGPAATTSTAASQVGASGAKAEKAVRISPSLMCADWGRLETAIAQLEAAGADMIHVDVADGHFVPNLLIGLDVIRWLRRNTSLPLDVHLMVEEPAVYLEDLASIGVERVAVHPEGCVHLDRVLTQIRQLGMKAAAALNPATPLATIEYVLERLDFVLLMTVNPGFAGQKLVASAIRKIADCRARLAQFGHPIEIMVDGNVSFGHIPDMVAAGADILVAGTSSWFTKEFPWEVAVRKTQEAIDAGLRRREKKNDA